MKNHVLITLTIYLVPFSMALWPIPVDQNKASIERWPPIKLPIVEPYFPIAFSIRATQNLKRIAKLVQQIYRPQNFYCIHIDKAATVIYNSGIEKALSGFGDNVFFVPNKNRVAMNGGKVATLEADLVCANLLHERSSAWHYWINLSGEEIPLKTNWELVTALQLLNGSNAVNAYWKKRKKSHTTPESYLDLNVTWYQGDDSVAVRREFVTYLQKNDLATLLLDAFRAFEEDFGPIGFAEGYFSILNNNPSVFAIPGAYKIAGKPVEIEAPIRAEQRSSLRIPCRSRAWHGTLCLYGASDVPLLKTHPHFFVQSFAPSFTEEARIELEMWHLEKLRHEVRTGTLHPSFNEEYYTQLKMTKMHL